MFINVLVASKVPSWRIFQAAFDSKDISVRMQHIDSLDSALKRSRWLEDYDVMILNATGQNSSALEGKLDLLHSKCPGSRFALVSSDFGFINVLDLHRLGVCALIHEHAAGEQIVSAVSAAFRSDLYVSAFVAGQIRSKGRPDALGILGGTGDYNSAIEFLSERELDVLELVAKGMSNRGIAENLFISEKTVKNHLYSAYRKLGVKDRTQAAMAVVKGLLSQRNESFGPE